MIQTQYFPMRGGWNQEAPPLAMNPGELVDCANYECLVNGGYRRIFGYELYDGQSTPSQAVPGVGPVLGVHIYKGEVYAIREDGANGRLYRATASGWVEVNNTITWSLNGNYKFANYNFGGQDAQETMYIVNGIDKAYKFDGLNFTQLTTGSGTDNPSLVLGYRYHLMLGVESSLVISGIGNPESYLAGDGAAEIAVGDTITNLREHTGALIIGCEDSTKTLYGSSSADWELQELNQAGSYEDTMQSIGGIVVGLDRQGVMSLMAAQQYGNFAYSSISQKIASYVRAFGKEAVSTINRTNSQYRIFNGADGLYFTFNGPQLVGVTRTLFANDVACIANGVTDGDFELSVFGSSDGNVYKMDSGFNFAGTSIYAFLLSTFSAVGGPTTNKRYRLIQPDIRVEGDPMQVFVRATTEYGLGRSSRGTSEFLFSSPGSLWDVSKWGEFNWDSTYSNDAKVRVSVTGSNMGVYISTDGSEQSVHTIYGITLHYSPRRLQR